MSNVYVHFEMTEDEQRGLLRCAMREAERLSTAGIVNAVIASVLDVDDSKVLPHVRLREELGADEGDVWALALALEDELDVGFGGVEYASVLDWVTVADVISYCEEAFRKQHARVGA